MLWQMRLAHAGEKALYSFAHKVVLKDVFMKLDFCNHCVPGKQTCAKFGTSIHRTKDILDCVHTDVCGPSKTASIGGRH